MSRSAEVFFVIVHGYKNNPEDAEPILPFVHITGDEEEHDKCVKDLQDDIANGGLGDLIWVGKTDSLDLHLWAMPFNK